MSVHLVKKALLLIEQNSTTTEEAKNEYRDSLNEQLAQKKVSSRAARAKGKAVQLSEKTKKAQKKRRLVQRKVARKVRFFLFFKVVIVSANVSQYHSMYC